MKVQLQKTDNCSFASLAIGDVFQCTNGLFLKTEAIEQVNGFELNAVNLSNGKFANFQNTEMILPKPNAEIKA